MEEVKLAQELAGLGEGGNGVEVVNQEGALELMILDAEYFHRCKWCLGWCLEWGQDYRILEDPRSGVRGPLHDY